MWREFLAAVEDDLHPRATVIVLGDARTNGRDPRADLFAGVAGQGGKNILAQPGAPPVLELWRLRDRGLRAALRGLRMLDHQAARRVRQGAHAACALIALVLAAPGRRSAADPRTARPGTARAGRRQRHPRRRRRAPPRVGLHRGRPAAQDPLVGGRRPGERAGGGRADRGGGDQRRR